MIKIKSVTIKAAWIMGGLTVLAAIIGGLFILYSSEPSTTSTFSFKENRDVIIYNNVPETATKEAIKRFEELENKVNQTEDKIELTREEIRLLSQALKDLDQRTSGITKLPDGRTKFGGMISGTPSIVIQEQNSAAELFSSGNYAAALLHSQNAIKAYEDSVKEEASVGLIQGGRFSHEDIGKLYFLGAGSAYYLKQYELSYQYAKKAVEHNPSPTYYAALSETLYELGKYQEALENIEKSLQAEPNNSGFLELKKLILLKL